MPPRAIRPNTAPALQEIILRCLEPLPDQRYAAAEELSLDLRHYDLVQLTERAARVGRAGFKTVFGRWTRRRKTMRDIKSSARKPPPRGPIILVAVDLRPGLDEMRHALLEASASALANMPGARLGCLNVMQTSLIAIDENVDATGDNIHVQRIAELRRWAEPLELPRGKVTYHLLEARSIAGGIVDFARSNAVDHLIIGAPTSGGPFGSRLSAQITVEAPCTVTVVRLSVGSSQLDPQKGYR